MRAASWSGVKTLEVQDDEFMSCEQDSLLAAEIVAALSSPTSEGRYPRVLDQPGPGNDREGAG